MNVITAQEALAQGVTIKQVEACAAWHIERAKDASNAKSRKRHQQIAYRLMLTAKNMKKP